MYLSADCDAMSMIMTMQPVLDVQLNGEVNLLDLCSRAKGMDEYTYCIQSSDETANEVGWIQSPHRPFVP